MDAQRSPPVCWGAGPDVAPLLVLRVMARLATLDHHVPSVEEVAAGLAMSVRTLRRKLRALGTSYSEILQQVRLARAESLLLGSSLTVECISEALGYTEPGNFRQAFRRWTGSSPRSFRSARPTGDGGSRSVIAEAARVYGAQTETAQAA